MIEFKQKAEESLLCAVREVYPEASRLGFEEQAEGFFCDYELPQPLDPESFSQIGAALKEQEDDVILELDRFSGVYENGSASGRMVQRIYVLAFESESALREYKNRRIEASQRDHRVLGQQLRLFSSSEEIGQGLVLWHPKGAMVRHLLEEFDQKAHLLNGYQWVYSPHIGRAELWERSGHLDFYRDSMYSPIAIDGEEYYLKPMSCPFHIAIYNSEPHSYRDLPVRLAEFGTVYRYELSGTLSGLTRVRGFTQDDAHILCTPEQVEDEIAGALQLSLYILHSFGFDEFSAYIATKPEEKSIGDNEQWARATEILRGAVESAGMRWEYDEGGGAFYGPKIDLKLRDALGRQWQCSTIQFDFNLPERFGMHYVGQDGLNHTPVMVHRALFGSIERFMAMLIEYYRGDFPFWFAPVQLGVVPIRPQHGEYCRSLARELRRRGLRVALRDEDDNLRGKIKALEKERVPYILVVGDREVERGVFSVRSRKAGELGAMDVGTFEEYLKPELEQGMPQCLSE